MYYNTYKDSDIPWLGQIPQHWQVCRLKFAAKFNNEALSEKTDKDIEIKYVEISDVSLVNGIEKIEIYTFGDAPSRARRITKINDIIISTVRTYLKAIAIIENDDLIVSTGFAVIRSQRDRPKFLYYALLNDGFLEGVLANSNGVNYPSINSSTLSSLKIALPPLSEQEAIVQYLEERCREVDERIERAKHKIELLQELKQSIITEAVTRGLDPTAPTQDSGIPWLGQIPQHWQVRRLKNVVHKIKSGGTPTSGNLDYYTEDGIPWVTIADMSNTKDVYDTVSKITEEGMWSKQLELHPEGTLLYSIYATIGKVATLGVPATTNQAILALYVKTDTITNNYLKAVLSALEPIVLAETSSNTQSNLNAGKVANFILPLPPLSEQEAIVQYLEERCREVDERIEQAKHKIELLQELKQSIITEAVTGKIKVC